MDIIADVENKLPYDLLEFSGRLPIHRLEKVVRRFVDPVALPCVNDFPRLTGKVDQESHRWNIALNETVLIGGRNRAIVGIARGRHVL
jgi:hypothetical protein